MVAGIIPTGHILAEAHKKRHGKPKNGPRTRIVIDTNVINQGIGRHNRIEKETIKQIETKDRHVYTKPIDEELRRVHDPNPLVNLRILSFANRRRKRMVYTAEPTAAELNEYPVLRGDKKVMDAAFKAKATVIVTNDRKFRTKGNGFRGMRVITPEQYREANGNKTK